jgi:hypothetical protein
MARIFITPAERQPNGKPFDRPLRGGKRHLPQSERENQMPGGACLCGAVRLDVQGELPPPDACHRSHCRKSSGHYFASTDVPRDRLAVLGAEHVTSYLSSETVRRGFCSVCGSPLFWDPLDRDWTAVATGAFDPPTETRLDRHIFVRAAWRWVRSRGSNQVGSSMVLPPTVANRHASSATGGLGAAAPRSADRMSILPRRVSLVGGLEQSLSSQARLEAGA